MSPNTRSTFLLLLLLVTASLYAQDNTLVMGQLNNIGLVTEIEINVNEKYLNNEQVVYTAEVNSDGRFAFPLEINEAQLVTLSYSRNRTLIYLEPNDTLEIKADANSFPYSMTFGHRSGANNTQLKKYYEVHPPETDPFQMKQYRSGGTYWYINTSSMERMMAANIPDQFRQKMNLRKQKALANFDFFVQNNPDALTPQFRDFMSSEIIYDWAYHLLLYGTVYKNKFGIKADFFDFLDEVPLQGESIGNYYYREFLKAYLCHRFVASNNTGNPYAGQYDMAADYFSGKPLAFLQSDMITRGFRANEVEALQRKYWDFTDHNIYPQFNNKVVDVYYKIMKYAEGSLAPDFTLEDKNGQAVSLSSYKGKVVYLNFWASWCKPCMAKMDQLRSIQAKLEQEGIVFLNVSLDRQKDTWLNTLSSKGIGGINVLANGDIESDVARSYQIKILPQYYIIDRNGYFANKPKEHDLIEIESLLSQLNNQN